MYTITRADAADILNISTRSLDRYIKSGKIRAKKEGKIVYLNSEDIKMMSGNNNNHEVIIPQKQSYENTENFGDSSTSSTGVVRKSDYDKISASFEKVFNGLREEIQRKDEKIEELSIKLGRAEEVTKNSVSLIDHKKSQFLLEESKTHLNKELSDIKTVNNKLEEELKYEKTTNKLLIAFVILLLIIAAVIWFVKI
ncbi:MAG: hypothetical protein PHH06_04035 [Candidatus Gracilibacteria bacterium]|nr:hypothetical protein [Candidatus Gracilibacteria bacterium]